MFVYKKQFAEFTGSDFSRCAKLGDMLVETDPPLSVRAGGNTLGSASEDKQEGYHTGNPFLENHSNRSQLVATTTHKI